MSLVIETTDVAVTGLGAFTPLGGDVAATWSALLAGKIGVSPIEAEWVEQMPVKFAAQAAVDPLTRIDRVKARRMDRSSQMAVIAATEAWEDAGRPQVDGVRLAVVCSSGIGGIITLLDQYDNLVGRGPRRVSPLTVPMLMPNAPAANVGLAFGAKARVQSPVSACASGSESIAMARDIIRLGYADVVIAGGTEAAIYSLPIAGFAAARTLSNNEDYIHASRPFDVDRDGFVLGEGAGIVVLERAEFAAARGARVHAWLSGVGMASDGFNIVAPDPEGTGACRAMELALEDAGASAADVVHVNAHATSTDVGDLAEAKALRMLLGPHLGSVPVSATKSQTGHLLGGAGALEAIFSIKALEDRIAPATRNTVNVDPGAADLDLVLEENRPLPTGGIALNNSFGFGGHDVALAFHL